MRWKGIGLRLIPVFVLTTITIIMSMMVYFRMLENEAEICWNRLEVATNSASEKIKIRMDDNINFLKTVADAYILTENMDDLESVGKYLDSVVEMTIFQRIDIIRPNNTIITQGGSIAERGGELSFDELANRGTHITQRRTSSFTGEEVICIVTPIKSNQVVLGLLVGTISCDTLSDIFKVHTYGEDAQMFLIDRKDGDYIMDNWHKELGNIYELGLRKSIDGRRMIDMVPAFINGEQERIAFVSNTSGENTYQYCAPVEGYYWTLGVAVQEDVVFANAYKLRGILLSVAVVEVLLLVLYVVWNTILNIRAVRNENKLQKLEFEKMKTEARSKFISNMSHDIKTPLNGIVGMVEVAKKHEEDLAKIKDCLKKIEISAKYLSTLTSDVLDIEEIENNKLELTDEPVNLRDVVDDVNSIMEQMAKSTGVSYSMDCSELKQPYILGSAIHIKRVLINLINNAVKYSKEAGKNVWVTVTDEEYVKDKRMYHFVIKDNGIGMSEAFQKNMYHAFEQENENARSEYQGYGLGLTIVNYLVKKMDGTIALESKKGSGSTFIVSVPFATDNREVKEEQDEIKQVSLEGLRILLVEDNEFNMEVAETLLSDEGVWVEKAVNGKIATEIFASSKENMFDVIIMDVMMPEMDGLEATRVIRNMKRRDAKTVPIIAMTANTFTEDVNKCKDAGMDAFIPKPLDVKYLMVTIANCKVSMKKEQD